MNASSIIIQAPPKDIKPLVERWFASLSQKEKELQILAAKTLKTSYFPEKTHGFRKWLATQPKAR